VLGQGLIAFGMRRLPVGLVSVVLVLQPVFAALLGWMILGQSLSVTQVCAGVLVVAGIYLARRGSIPAA
jgi:drug/metabolite transporter (DMT)-like permease